MLSWIRASSIPNASASRRRGWSISAALVVPSCLILVTVGLAVFVPLVTSYDPEALGPTERLAPPSRAHLLGTDEFGRDTLARLGFGARITLLVSVVSIGIAAPVGAMLGMGGAYYGGFAETILMRTADGLLAFPPILVAIFVIAFLGPSLVNVILVIALLYLPRFARIAHSSTLALRETEYILAGIALGLPHARILRKHVFPNILAPVVVQASLGFGHAILLESGLSFLGLGPPPPAPSWGRMIAQSNRFIGLSVWPVLWPALVVSASVLAFNVLGDALRDIHDPRLRKG